MVRVIVCDSKGACSTPAVQEVSVRANPPPTGEILFPRADDCLTSQNSFDMRVRYRDPDGGTVRMKVFIDDIEVSRENFTADPNGNYLEGVITVDTTGLSMVSIKWKSKLAISSELVPLYSRRFDHFRSSCTSDYL